MSEVQRVNRETTLIEWEKKLHSLDLLQIGEELVQLMEEEDRVCNEKKDAMAKYAATLKRIDADRHRKTCMLRDKVEYIEEECSWDLDYENGLVHYISVESGEIVKSRDMTKEECQMKLFDENALKQDDVQEIPEVVEEVENPAAPEAPVCHMKPMEIATNENGEEVYSCSVCKHTQQIEGE